jgi:hypothetical protein
MKARKGRGEKGRKVKGSKGIEQEGWQTQAGWVSIASRSRAPSTVSSF